MMGILEISILVLVAIAVFYAVFRFIQNQNLKYIFREYRKQAYRLEEKIINNPRRINITTEKEALGVMKKRFMKLRKKFRDNPKMLAEIAKYWTDYLNTILEFLAEKEVFEIDLQDDDNYGDFSALGRFRKRVTELIIKKNRIEKRFCELLGISDKSMRYIKLKWGSYEDKRK